jgi:hypothetical protein
VESAPVTPRRLIEPGRITSYLLIAGAGLLLIVELAMSLEGTLPGKVGIATWVVLEAPGLALMAAFTGAAAAAGGSWWARRRESASGTTLPSIGYGLGTAAIAAAVVAVLAWASIDQEVSGKVALATFAAALAGGLFGSVRIGGAALGGLVAVLISMLIGTAGTIVFSWTLADADPDPRALASHIQTTAVVGSILRGVAVVVGAVVGCRWLARRRRETPLPYFIVVGAFPAALQLVSIPIAWLAALPVADDLPASDGVMSSLASQQTILLLVAVVAGTTSALVCYGWHRLSRRSAARAATQPAAAM